VVFWRFDLKLWLTGVLAVSNTVADERIAAVEEILLSESDMSELDRAINHGELFLEPDCHLLVFHSDQPGCR
jgi:hypothetical protein